MTTHSFSMSESSSLKKTAAKALAAARRLRAFMTKEEGLDFRLQSTINYRRHISRLLAEMPREEAMIKAIGAPDARGYATFGDVQVQVLRAHGLINGMSIYDLGCGSGRTAQALQRNGWEGSYMGHDVVPELVDHLIRTCPGFSARTHLGLSLLAEDSSLDMVYHWSVFTHLLPEECYVYLKDTHRSLKPGGTLLFSFLELEDQRHDRLFHERASSFERHDVIPLLDTFLHRDWIRAWASELAFSPPKFTAGKDATHHPAFWQSLVRMTRVAA